jgi:hypothetical protein
MTVTRGSGLIRALSVFAIWISTALPALGQPRTDVVKLANGDHVTGEILRLERGRLELKTDDAGTIAFEWDNIASIESTRQFDIATSDERRVLGSLRPGVGRVVTIATGAGDLVLPMPEITTIYPIGRSFWARLDGYVNMGYSYTRSSAIGQLSLNMETTFRRPAFLIELTMSGTLTEQPGVEQDDRGDLNLGYKRYRGRWLAGAGGSFENNESLGIVLRSQVGGMVGQRFVNTNRAELEAAGGLVFNNEQGVDTPTSQNVEALASVRSSFFTYDGSQTNFSMSIDYYISLSTFGRQRLQFDCGFKRDLWKDFSFSINVFDTFDSDPPNAEAERNDAGVVTSVGWTY